MRMDFSPTTDVFCAYVNIENVSSRKYLDAVLIESRWYFRAKASEPFETGRGLKGVFQLKKVIWGAV